jgi:hypothetical protein
MPGRPIDGGFFMAAVAVDPVPELPAYAERILRWKTATLGSIAVALWVTMAEIDRLIAGAVPAGGGASRTASGLQGLDAGPRADSWAAWRLLDPGGAAELSQYLHTYAVIDSLFALSYFWLLWRAVRRYRWLRGLALLVLACELGESVTLAFLSTHLEAGGAAVALVVLAYLKWGLLALLGISVLYYRVLRRLLVLWIRRTRQAVLIQRLSFFAVLAVAAMALIPIPGVSDQLPDAQRAWAPDGFAAGHWWLALVVVLVGTAGLFVLGRRRSELAWALHVSLDPKLPASVAWWAYGPALLVTGLILASVFGRLPQPPAGWILAFLGVPAAVVLLSLPLRGRFPSLLPAPWTPDRPRAVAAWRCGDVLACSFLVVSGIALIRSFTGPVVLGATNGWPAGTGWSALFLGCGWLVVLAGFFTTSFLLRRTWSVVAASELAGLLDPRQPSTAAATFASRVSLAAAAVVLTFLLAFPSESTQFLGVPATAVVSVLAWTVVVGFMVVQLQRQRAIWLFEKLGLRANPLASLILLTLFINSLGGGDGRIHAIRHGNDGTDGRAQSVRLTVGEYVDRWIAANQGCTVAVDGTDGGVANVRPVIFVAAEGGGIRAAAWTAAAFEKLGEVPCGRESVILSSGVSGGSLGLVVTQLYGQGAGLGAVQGAREGTGETAVDVVGRIAGPDALAAGVAGALVGDLVAGGTDVLVGTGPDTDSGFAWQDRAGAMERAWEESAPRLAERWEPAVPGNSRTGALVLNSTASGIGCRLLISQLDLDGTQPTQDGAPANGSCRQGTTPLSIDLLGDGACPLNLSWSTAAMLSARFPIISPAGRVPYRHEGECSAAHAYQAIDGGYSEGSGLGTVHDLWPAFQTRLRTHNQTLGAGGAFLVPVFLFLQNSGGSDVVAGPPELAGELAVPLAGISAKNLQSDAASWMQRLDAGADVCPAAAAQCRAATAAFARSIGGSSLRVAPDSRPALDPPLGWTLSPLSRDGLRRAMDAEAVPCTEGTGKCPGFARVLDELRRSGAAGP